MLTLFFSALCGINILMNAALATLPDNTEDLKEMVVYRDEEISHLREQNRLLKCRLYGRSSEKGIVGLEEQQALFSQEDNGEEPEPDADQGIEIPKHTRKKTRKSCISDDLPREDIIHDISEEEKVCECGACRVKIAEETNLEVEYQQAKITVRRHIRPKYVCLVCDGDQAGAGAIKVAPPIPQLIPKGIATPNLLAHIFTARYADGLPLYRQEKQFQRLGLNLGRASMSQWTVKIAEKCEMLIDFLKQAIKKGPWIQIDETRFQVLREFGRSNKQLSQMWVMRGGPPGAEVVLYNYRQTRSKEVVAELLAGYKGYVQSDGYAAYDFLEKWEEVYLLACWAHAGRKFKDVVKGTKVKAGAKMRTTDRILKYIRQLYAIEKQARLKGLSDSEIVVVRQKDSKPILEKIKVILDDVVNKTPPKGLLGIAVAYALTNWSRLIRYLEAGYLNIDNNGAENKIRPFVIGRKAWLFSGHPCGAFATATFFSLIETAKANGWEPYAYMKFLMNGLLHAESAIDYIKLLPFAK